MVDQVRSIERLRELLSGRLVRGTAATTYGHVLQIAIQLLSVPLLTRAWGLEGYGMWMIAFTLPQLLTVGDLGLVTAGGNAMTATIARGDRQGACEIYGALRWVTLLLGVALAGIAALAMGILSADQLHQFQNFTRGHGFATGVALLGYGVLGLANMVTLIAFRATDAFASSNFLLQTIILVEAIGALGTAALGYGPETVAVAYFCCRLTGTGFLIIALRRHASWLRAGWKPRFTPLRALIAPSIAALMLPAAYAVVLQGSVLAIGAAGGAAAVPLFTTTRTLSRSALQFAFAINLASIPRYAVAVATHDQALRERLVAINLIVVIGLLLPVALFLLMIGQPFVSWWTGGNVLPPFTLVALMVATMLANSTWVPISNFILATNDQAEYSYFFLGAMIATVIAGYFLTSPLGAVGMAIACLCGETVMAIWVWRTAYRLGTVDSGMLRRSITAMLRGLPAR